MFALHVFTQGLLNTASGVLDWDKVFLFDTLLKEEKEKLAIKDVLYSEMSLVVH